MIRSNLIKYAQPFFSRFLKSAFGGLFFCFWRAPMQIEAPEVAVPSGQGEGCRDIAVIALSGATVMSVREQARIVAPYEGRCLGVAEIQGLLADVTAFYIKNG
jgi:hemolysin activation/secretion protein